MNNNEMLRKINKHENKDIPELREQLDTNALHVTGWINVKSFGCKGDGITDDSACFQMALDTGLNVIVPSGTYIVGGLKLKKGQILDGLCTFNYSWGEEVDPTVLKSNGSEYIISDGRASTIKNIHINGNNLSNGIKGGKQNNEDGTISDGKIELTNCRIYNCLNGVVEFRCGSTINKCNFDHNINGIYSIVDCRVINNTFNSNETALYLYDSNDNQISNNKIEWNSKNGIHIDTGVNNLITSNTIDRNLNGIYIKNATRGTIVGNVFRRNIEYNINFNGCSKYSIIGNSFNSDYTDTETSGEIKPVYHLYLNSFGDSVISNNITNGGTGFIDPTYSYRTDYINENNLGTNIKKDKYFINFNVSVQKGSTTSYTLNYPDGFTQMNTHITSLKIGESNENFKINSTVIEYNAIMNTDNILFNFKNNNTEYNLSLRVRLILEKEH